MMRKKNPITKKRGNKIMSKKYEKGYPCMYSKNKVRHWNEITNLERVIGMIRGIQKMIKEENYGCREIMTQVSAASEALQPIVAHILGRHIEICLDNDNFSGATEEQEKEWELALNFLKKIRVKREWFKEKLKEMLDEV